MNRKTCPSCKENKPASEFHSCGSRSDGLGNYCKKCKSVKARDYYEKNKSVRLEKAAAYRKANPEEVSRAKKRCYQAKKPQYLKKTKERYENKKDEILLQCRDYRARNKARKSEMDRNYVSKRMTADGLFRLSYNMRTRVRLAFIRQGVPKRGKTLAMLGCDWEHLKAYIEAKFVSGMTWENRGSWHIDHVIPLASAKTVEEMERLCHYTNLQPLWASDNIRKGARMVA